MLGTTLTETKEKLYSSKKFFLDLKKFFSDESRIELDDFNQQKPTSENEMIDKYLDSLNIDIELRNVETNFYKNRKRTSERIMFQSLIFFILLLLILSILIYFLTPLRDLDDCLSNEWNNGRIIWSVFFYLFVFLFLISILLILKLNDQFLIRNEILLTSALTFLYLIPVWMSKENNNHLLFLLSTIIFSTLYVTVYLMLPLYLSYSWDKDKNNFQEREKDGANQKERRDGDEKGKGKEKQEEEPYESNNYENLIQILNDPNKIKYFINWAKDNFSIENVLFYRVVCSLRKQNKKNHRLQMCSEITKNFIEHGSRLQINISEEAHKLIMQKYESNPYDRTIFDKALEEIVQLMLNDSFSRFIHSSYAYQMLIHSDSVNPILIFQSENSERISYINEKGREREGYGNGNGNDSYSESKSESETETESGSGSETESGSGSESKFESETESE
ncbi:double hit isoform b [Anaeramoeba flamelloides]|uniref:Double hit isoform b n=1 Tax=Anaeramoeba flamelloides TaxID=1746091 RepID=A0AAV7ZG88_9EUKA|nr:double hit isoform b [Anaeramoeba flamelloides]